MPFARMPPPEERQDGDEDEAALDEELAAVEPVDGIAFERRLGEETMKEKRGCREVDAEVERLPETAAHAQAKVGSDDDESQQAERGGADGVFQRLARRMDGIEQVQKTKARLLVEKQDRRVGEREGKRGIAGPIVQTKIIEAAMGPGAVGTVAKSQEHAENEVQSDGADRGQSNVGGKVEDRNHDGETASTSAETG